MPNMHEPDAIDAYEEAVDLAVAACGSDERAAIKALLIANEFLERELEALAMQLSNRNVLGRIGVRLAS